MPTASCSLRNTTSDPSCQALTQNSPAPAGVFRFWLVHTHHSGSETRGAAASSFKHYPLDFRSLQARTRSGTADANTKLPAVENHSPHHPLHRVELAP